MSVRRPMIVLFIATLATTALGVGLSAAHAAKQSARAARATPVQQPAPTVMLTSFPLR